jgi:hypothetical protein
MDANRICDCLCGFLAIHPNGGSAPWPANCVGIGLIFVDICVENDTFLIA